MTTWERTTTWANVDDKTYVWVGDGPAEVNWWKPMPQPGWVIVGEGVYE